MVTSFLVSLVLVYLIDHINYKEKRVKKKQIGCDRGKEQLRPSPLYLKKIKMILTLEGIKPKELYEGIRRGLGEGGGGQSDPFPLLSTPFFRLT